LLGWAEIAESFQSVSFVVGWVMDSGVGRPYVEREVNSGGPSVFRKTSLIIGAASLLFVASLSSSMAAGLAAHKAVYSIDLKSARASSGVVGVSGGTVYEFADACNGWVVENKTHMVFNYAEGPAIESAWAFSAWESKDAKDFRFTVRHARNGQIVENFQGTIARQKKGGAGVARITKPEEIEIAFPAGTEFPTEHMMTLLKAAGDGKTIVRRVLFDGAGIDNPFDVNAVIGREKAPHPITAKGGKDFAESPTWAMRLAYFALPGQESAPNYEMELRYRKDGIAEHILQDFGDFVLKANLRRIEKLPNSGC